MDEAGGFHSSQLRAQPLRNLTLGVLIVTGGTLAALPFRKQPIVPDASVKCSQATGPTDSVLQQAPVQILASQSSSADPAYQQALPPESLSRAQFAAAAIDQFADELPMPDEVARQRRRRRSVEVPLTFDDLMQPIERPAPIAERFNAVASPTNSPEQGRAMALKLPSIESDSMSLHDEFQQRFSSIVPQMQPRQPPDSTASTQTNRPPSRSVTGSLASSSPSTVFVARAPSAAEQQEATEKEIEPLPPPSSEPKRPRHWIMQP